MFVEGAPGQIFYLHLWKVLANERKRFMCFEFISDCCCWIWMSRIQYVRGFVVHLFIVVISMAECKTAIAPLLMRWSYCSLAASHRYYQFMWIQGIHLFIRISVTLLERTGQLHDCPTANEVTLTKWPSFCRWYYRMQFREWKCMNCD